LRHPPTHKAAARQAEVIEAAVARRLYRYLLAQGFDAGRVHAAIRNRLKNAVDYD
jgi:hypothetical protein